MDEGKTKTFRQDFANEFSSSAFRRIDGEMTVCGKWGRIVQLDDGAYDLWLVGPDLAPLTRRKLTATAKKAPEWLRLTILEGEAYAQGWTRDFVLQSARLAGVKKKRRIVKKGLETTTGETA